MGTGISFGGQTDPEAASLDWLRNIPGYRVGGRSLFRNTTPEWRRYQYGLDNPEANPEVLRQEAYRKQGYIQDVTDLLNTQNRAAGENAYNPAQATAGYYGQIAQGQANLAGQESALRQNLRAQGQARLSEKEQGIRDWKRWKWGATQQGLQNWWQADDADRAAQNAQDAAYGQMGMQAGIMGVGALAGGGFAAMGPAMGGMLGIGAPSWARQAYNTSTNPGGGSYGSYGYLR